MDRLIFLAEHGSFEQFRELAEQHLQLINEKNSEGKTPIIAAIIDGNINKIKYLLDHEVDLSQKYMGLSIVAFAAMWGRCNAIKLILDNNPDLVSFLVHAYNVGYNIYRSNTSPLYLAVKYNRRDVVNLLLDNGANIYERNYDIKYCLYLDSLHIAAIEGFLVMVKTLESINIKNKINPSNDINKLDCIFSGKEDYLESVTSSGNTPLHMAALYKRAEVVNYLAQKASDIDKKTDKGKTALHYAAIGGEEDCVDILLDNGADVNAFDNKGYEAMHFAAKKGHITIIEKLHQKGWRANHSFNPHSISPMSLATLNRRPEAIRRLDELLREDSGLCEANDNGHKPVHIAAIYGFLDCLEVLVALGADPKGYEENEVGNHPIHYASAYNQLEIVNYLADKENLEVKNFICSRPIHLAAKNNALDVLKRLAELGVDVNAKDIEYKTAVHYLAMQQGDLADAFNILMIHGADFNAVDINGQTPLHHAVESGNISVIKFMLHHGALAVSDRNGNFPCDLTQDSNIKELTYNGSYHQHQSCEDITESSFAFIEEVNKIEDSCCYTK